MNYHIDENPDRWSEFGFKWQVIHNDEVIEEGLECSYELAEIDAKNYIEEHS